MTDQLATGAKPVLICGTPFEGEQDIEIHYCNVFLRLGPKRSRGLLRTYLVETEGISPSMTRLSNAYHAYLWEERAAEYDRNLDEYQGFLAYRSYHTGFSVTEARIEEFKRLYTMVKEIIDEKGLLKYTELLDGQKVIYDGLKYLAAAVRLLEKIGEESSKRIVMERDIIIENDDDLDISMLDVKEKREFLLLLDKIDSAIEVEE